MGFILREYMKGILLRGESSDITDNLEGSIFHNSSTKKLKTYIDSAIREIITSSQAQTLTNKTIDYNSNTILNFPSGGGGVNTNLSNLVAPTQIPVDLFSTNTSSFTIGTVDSVAQSGSVTLTSGQASGIDTGSSGSVRIQTGNATGNKDSGNIFLETGTSSSGIRGSLYIDAKMMFCNSATALLTSTFNNIISTQIDLLNISGTVYHKHLTSSATLQFINGVPGKRFTVVVNNVTSGALSINFPTVRQKAGTIVTTVSANTANIYEFVNSSNQYYCISCITNIV